MKTGAALSAKCKRARTHVHARVQTVRARALCMQRPLVNARVRLLRAGKSSRSRGRPTPESRALFYERSGPRTRVYFSISIYHPRVFLAAVDAHAGASVSSDDPGQLDS